MRKAKSIVALIVSLILTAIVGVACFASFPVPFTHKTKQYNSIMSLIGTKASIFPRLKVRRTFFVLVLTAKGIPKLPFPFRTATR